MLVWTTVISTSASMVVFLKPFCPLAFRMGADWIRTIGWVLKISCCVKIFISILLTEIPYWLCKSTLLVMHLGVSTVLGKMILIGIFGKETGCGLSTYGTSGARHSEGETTIFFKKYLMEEKIHLLNNRTGAYWTIKNAWAHFTCRTSFSVKFKDAGKKAEGTVCSQEPRL